MCDALLPHSRPRPILPVAKRVRTFLPTHLWPVLFGTQRGWWGCLRTHRLLYHPLLLSFAAPPQVCRLCCWSRLHSAWRRGSHCPACLAGSRAQFDSATRFSSPGDLPSLTTFSRRRWQSGTPLSCARRLLSSWQRMQSSRSLQPRWGRGFTALTSSYPRKSTNSESASFEPGFTQAPVQDADAQVHYQMHPAPGLVCSDRPEGCLRSCFDPSATQTVPTVCVRRSGMAVQGPPLRALPVSPCVHEGRKRCPYPVTGSGRQDLLLPWRLAYPSPIQRAVGRSLGDLVLRHLSQLGLRANWEKSKLSPVQRISFLGVELDSVSMTARLTEECAQAVLNCLSSFRGRNVVPLKQFQRLLGHMASAAAVTSLRLLHMRPLQHCLHSRVLRWAWRRGTLRVGITQQCRRSLSPWTDLAFLRAGVPLEQLFCCHNSPSPKPGPVHISVSTCYVPSAGCGLCSDLLWKARFPDVTASCNNK